MKKKVGVISLGCPKNLVDSEIMLGRLSEESFEITNDKTDAEILIVNTCGFIDSAKQESISTILEMAECKKGRCQRLIVTGCLAERYKDEILREIPEVDAVIGTGSYGEIAEVIARTYKAGDSIEGVQYPKKVVLCPKPDEIGYLDSDRVLSGTSGYAYLKIAEGCDNCCTYCIIPSLRGRYRSRSMEAIIKEAESLSQKGIREIILVAQDTTRYGRDLYGKNMLVDLLRNVSKIEGIEWIRILYSYPEEIDDALIDEFAVNSKICKYMDIPVQHASDRILGSMGRRGKSADIRSLIKKLREKIEDIVIRTTLIVGFPGEEEGDFQELLQFVRESEFDRLGVFTYSREEGTPAADMEHQVDAQTMQRRYDAIMSLQKEISEKRNRLRLHRTYTAMVEGVSEDGIFYTGRTYAEAPGIDGAVYFTSREPLEAGKLVRIKILNTDEYDLIGDVIYESA